MVKVKNKKDQILIFLSGVMSAVLGLFYLLNKLDFVPDGLGFVGYIDDIIVILMIFFLSRNLFARITGRFRSNKAAYTEFWRTKNVVKSLGKARTWKTIIIVGAAFAYFIWTLDFIPDVAAGIGHIDDFIVAIGALLGVMRLYKK